MATEVASITVTIGLHEIAACRHEAHAQFVVRQKLRDAGVPIGPWGTSAPLSGTLAWFDEPHQRVISWRPPADG